MTLDIGSEVLSVPPDSASGGMRKERWLREQMPAQHSGSAGPRPPAVWHVERVHGVTTGPGYRIRAFGVYRLHAPDLFDQVKQGACR